MGPRILIIDDDEPNRRTLQTILSSEGWHTEAVAHPSEGLKRLSTDDWNLVVAGVSRRSLSEPLFESLQELAFTQGPLRVLFLVPAVIEEQARQYLERNNLWYSTKPIRLNDLLDQVGELLLEAGAIRRPLRRVRELGQPAPRTPDPPAAGREMFAARGGYCDYDEEELLRFEKEEEEVRKKKARAEAEQRS